LNVIPSIDLIEGRVVRLIRGEIENMIVYSSNPVEVALKWESLGADSLHLVDLDAALGRGDNKQIIAEISKTVKIPIQVGGGIRSMEVAESILNLGIERIVIGTMAFKNLNVIKELVKKHGSQHIVIALDHFNGEVVINGWKTKTNMKIKEATEKFSRLGVETFLVTSVNKDGLLSGTDLQILGELSDMNVKIIAAGGISSLEDIKALKKMRVWGVVIGRALYEGVLSMRDIIKVAKGKQMEES